MNIFEEAQSANKARYDEIKHLSKEFEWGGSVSYACKHYTAKTNNSEAMALSARDVMLLADGGNLCFGGRGASKRKSGEYTIFSGTVHTD